MELTVQLLLNHMDYKAKNAVAESIAKDIVLDDEAKKEWFCDYGTMNGWGPLTSMKFAIANALHRRDIALNPKDHTKLPQVHNWRCWHEDNCSCGLCSSSDSSD